MNEAFFLSVATENMYMGYFRHPAAEIDGIFSPNRRRGRQSFVGARTGPAPGYRRSKGTLKSSTALPIGPVAKRKILYDNAARLFPR